MTYVILFYGFAFLVFGVLLLFQARSTATRLQPLCLWLLALFGLLHGTAEWVGMAIVIGSGAYPPWMQWGHLILTALSFTALLHFGIEMQISLRRWSGWTRSIPPALLLISAGLMVSCGTFGGFPARDALVRYLNGVPAALLAATSLVMESRRPASTGEDRRTGTLVFGAAIGFATYAFFAGIVVPRAAFPPASIVNAATFRTWTGIPVEVFRTACAALITGSLAEAFVIEANRLQTELKRLRTEAISAVAHDLRNSISAIGLSAELLEREMAVSAGSDRACSAVARIRSSTKNLERMVNDLSDVSNIEVRRLELNKERLDPRRLIEEIVERATVLLAGHSLRVRVPDTLPAVDVDPVRIEQVMVNFLSNAGKYADPGTEVEVTAEPKDDTIVISVTDIGPGIPADELSRLFAPFYRSRVVRGRVPGLGLGLFISKALIETHGGRAWVESDVGTRTTTFRFVLPAARMS